MKKQINLKFAVCAVMIGSLSLPIPASAGEVYSTVSKNMICNFNSDSATASWYNFADNADVKTVMTGSSGKEGCAVLSVNENGGKCTMAKNFRAQKCPFVLEFKIMPESGSGDLKVQIYDRNSKPYTFLIVKDTNLIVGGKTIGSIEKDKYTKISAVLTKRNKINVYIDDSLVKKDVSSLIRTPLTSVTAVKFGYESDKASSVCLDDIYAYEGSSLIDEFTLLSDDQRAIYRTKNAAAFVADFSKYYADRSLVEIASGTSLPTIIGGKFYIPAATALNALGIDASYDATNITADYNEVKYTIAPNSKVITSDKGSNTSLSAQTIAGENDILVCADDIASLFGLSKYFDNVDMYILSKGNNVYELNDEVDKLSANLKQQITNILYTRDSIGRLVKIAGSLDLFKGKKIPVAQISAPYQPQTENPVESAIDGDLSTRFAFDGSENYFVVDFGEVYDVEAFAIAWMNGHTRKDVYVMSYSTDGTNWVSFPKTMATGLSSEYQYHPLGVKARYIKYTGYGTIANDTGNSGPWNSVTEIVFYTEDK